MSVVKSPFLISLESDLNLCGDVYVPSARATSSSLPVLIFCHGFKGFKDWGAFPYMYERLAVSGVGIISFNFARNGIGENPLEFTELEKFKTNSLSLEVQDLKKLLEVLREGALLGTEQFDLGRIHLMGHSRGGSAVLRVAAEDPDICSVITIASISRIPPVSSRTEAAWRASGVHYVENMRTGQQMPMGIAMLDDLISTKDAMRDACKKVLCPVTIIHGRTDPVVPSSSAEELASWCTNSTLHLVDDGDHTFGVAHPFKGTNPIFEHVLDIAQDAVLRQGGLR